MLRIFEILVEGVIIYLLYKLIFNFIIPVYRSTKKVRKHMRDMQDRMNNQTRSRQQNFSSQQQYHYKKPPDKQPSSKATYKKNTSNDDGEYIDYEEVK